jgi:hypothetical protein
LFDTLTVGFDGGGWWKKEPRERVLSNLLYQVDSYLVLTDQIDLYQFSADSVETITKALLLSFNPSKVTKSLNDSGRVQWPEAYDKPSDVLNGKAVVPTHDAGTELNPSSEILDCRFLSGQSINAQKAGILHFQKKFEQSQRINFAVSFSRLTNQTTLCPGQVVTVDNTLYGGTNKVVLTDMTFLPSGRVNFTGVVLNYLEDWGDLTTTTKDVVTDASNGFELATTDYAGNVSSDWDLLLNIPQRFLDTATLGINVTDSYMGYFDGTDFTVYIDSNGNMQCGDPNTAQGFTWNQGTGVFTISGSLTIQNPAGVRTDLNVANGADVTASNPQDYTWITGTKPPSNADNTTTTINGGVITTGYIRDSSSNLVIDFSSAKITVNATDGLKVVSGDIGCYNGTTKVGSIEYSSSVSAFRIHAPSGPAVLSSANSYVNISAGNTVALWADTYVELRPGSSYWTASYGHLWPSSDDLYDLGDNAKVWRKVYTADIYVEDTISHRGASSLISFASDEIDLDSNGSIYLDAADAQNIYFYFAGIHKANINAGSLKPSTNDGLYLGTSTQRWERCYASAYYDEVGLFQDEQDDLFVLSQLSTKKQKIMDEQTKQVIREDTVIHEKSGMPFIDNLSLPRWMTNYDEVVEKLKQDNGDLITDADVEEWIQDHEEAGWMVCRNVGHFNDLTSGAVRQLDSEILAMFELLSARITALETRSN